MKQIIAFKCSFYGKVYELKSSCRSHEYRCYFNPQTKSCATCAFMVLGYYPLYEGNFGGAKSCLVNVDNGTCLHTKCTKYLNERYKEDAEINWNESLII